MRFICLPILALALLGCPEDGFKNFPPIVNGVSAGDGNNYIYTPPKAPDKPAEPSVCDYMVLKTCKQMSSCIEAEQQLLCGNSDLDGDKDGTPCNARGYVCDKPLGIGTALPVYLES